MLQMSAAPLAELLGFDALARIETLESAVAATLTGGAKPVAIVVSSWAGPLDPLWRLAVTQAMRRSATWCLLFDGLRLRIVDASRLYARRYLEFDLDLVLDNSAPFAAFWRTFNAASLTAGPAEAASLHALVAASDRHAAGVCQSLRDGVLEASEHVLRAFVVGSPTRAPRGSANRAKADLSRRSAEGAKAEFEQALTIVYRMLFLLFAEARALVPLWHPVYRESYSLEALRDIAEEPRRMPGLWDALRAIARLAHAGMPRRRPARDAVQWPAVLAGAYAAGRAPRSGR